MGRLERNTLRPNHNSVLAHMKETCHCSAYDLAFVSGYCYYFQSSPYISSSCTLGCHTHLQFLPIYPIYISHIYQHLAGLCCCKAVRIIFPWRP